MTDSGTKLDSERKGGGAPTQNRVNPRGDLCAVKSRGTLLGNRGQLKMDGISYVRSWANKRWIICEIDPKKLGNIKPGPVKYTKLFFLDEATALAAGHRPCSECQRPRFDAFKKAWFDGNADIVLGRTMTVHTLDGKLHEERLASGGVALQTSDPMSLPNGTFIENNGISLMVWDGKLRRWSSQGYELVPGLPPNTLVDILTPASTVNAFLQGFVPDIHFSAKEAVNADAATTGSN